MVADLLAAEPHGSWNVYQLCKLAYPEQRVEKKHRVAMLRAIHHVELEPPVWRWSDGYLFNAGDQDSTLRLAFNKTNFGRHEVDFEQWKQDEKRIDSAREKVQAFRRYHDASPIEKIDIDIASAQRSAAFFSGLGTGSGSTYFLRPRARPAETLSKIHRAIFRFAIASMPLDGV
jgi:hypothetical protein